VIVCSADTYQLHDQRASLDEYASAVLVKPFEIDDFHRCVEHALSASSPGRDDEEEQHQASSARFS
jgi:hypothetical protein